MLESINIVVNGKKFNVKKGITFLELSKMIEEESPHKILLGKIGENYYELSDQIFKSCKVEFLTLMHPYANRVYLNGLIYLANYCFAELYDNSDYLY